MTNAGWSMIWGFYSHLVYSNNTMYWSWSSSSSIHDGNLRRCLWHHPTSLGWPRDEDPGECRDVQLGCWDDVVGHNMPQWMLVKHGKAMVNQQWFVIVLPTSMRMWWVYQSRVKTGLWFDCFLFNIPPYLLFWPLWRPYFPGALRKVRPKLANQFEWLEFEHTMLSKTSWCLYWLASRYWWILIMNQQSATRLSRGNVGWTNQDQTVVILFRDAYTSWTTCGNPKPAVFNEGERGRIPIEGLPQVSSCEFYFWRMLLLIHELWWRFAGC